VDVAGFCDEHLGSPVAEVLFGSRSLSAVTGVRLADGREVVVKERPKSVRLRGCAAVHRALWSAGFPCPEPLVDPVPLGPHVVASAELYVPGGVQLEGHPHRYAEELLRLVALAPAVEDVPTLEPAPPWTAWDHDREGTWPVRDDEGPDLTTDTVPGWIADIARRAQVRLARCKRPQIVGHCDWESQNLRWVDDRLLVAHDWDSVAARDEPVIAGLAAAVHPADGPRRQRASVADGEAFLDAYGLNGDDREVAWAAGLWVLSFNAAKAAATFGGGPGVDALRADAHERLERARA